MIKEKVLIMNYDKAMYMKCSTNKSNSSDFLLTHNLNKYMECDSQN